VSIQCKVAQILSDQELVINAGTEDGVEEGMILDVMGTFEIKDPDTSETLDHIPFIKVAVKATLVRPKVSIAKTFKTVRDNQLSLFLGSPGAYLERFEYVQKEGAEIQDSTVYVGDLVKERMKPGGKE